MDLFKCLNLALCSAPVFIGRLLYDNSLNELPVLKTNASRLIALQQSVKKDSPSD